MSRFEHRVTMTNSKTSEVRPFDVAYGYDNPMEEYFIQVWDRTKPSDEEADEPIIWLGSRMTGTGREEMYGVMRAFGVPEEHLQKLILDVPI